MKVDVYDVATMCTFHVLPMKPDKNAHPIILGRPWLRELGAVQKWATCELIFKDDTKKVRYNLKDGKKESVKGEQT